MRRDLIGWYRFGRIRVLGRQIYLDLGGPDRFILVRLKSNRGRGFQIRWWGERGEVLTGDG
jgi:hypothetical protein